MLPSSTVENYLKAIYQGQIALAPGARLVSMGFVAAALGVTPGTATTMVKTLAEYETGEKGSHRQSVGRPSFWSTSTGGPFHSATNTLPR